MSKIKVTGIAAGEDGSVTPTPTVTVLVSDGGAKATIYSDADGTAKNNPFEGNSNGLFEFYADPEVYRIKVEKRNRTRFIQDYVAVGNVPYDVRMVELLHFSQVVNPYGNINTTLSPYAIQSWSTTGWSETSPPRTNLGGGDVIRGSGQKFQDVVGDGYETQGLEQAHPPAAWNQSACAVKWTGVGKRTFQVEGYVRPIGVTYKAQAGGPGAVTHYLGLEVVDTADFEAGTYTPTGWSAMNTYGPYPNTHVAVDDLPQLLIMEFVPLRAGETVVMTLGTAHATNGTQLPLGNVSMLVHP
jgi:hypothetical protein